VIDVEQLRTFEDHADVFQVLVLRQLQEMPAVCGFELPELVRGDEPLSRELPDRLQQAVAGARTVVIDQQQGLVDQTTKAVQHLRAAHPLVGAHLFGRWQREAAGEDGEPAQEHLLVGRQQRVAPLEHGPQRPVPGDLTGPTE